MCDSESDAMFLQFYLNESGDRVYTLKVSPDTTAHLSTVNRVLYGYHIHSYRAATMAP